MYRKLTDAQVITLMFILANNPPVPMDMDRYPTVRMFLDNNIVERKNGHLQLVLTAPEFAYQAAFKHIAQYLWIEECKYEDPKYASIEDSATGYTTYIPMFPPKRKNGTNR